MSSLDRTPDCGCCSTIRSYIAEHLDPSATIQGDENPEELLALLTECFPGEPLGIDADDLAEYLDEIRASRYPNPEEND
jgi:hypothetical protein